MAAVSHGARGYQETLLVDTLDRMRRNPEGRKVVHLHLSQLMPANRTPVRVKIVTRMFRALESGRQAQIFNLSNDDLALIDLEFADLLLDLADLLAGVLAHRPGAEARRQHPDAVGRLRVQR